MEEKNVQNQIDALNHKMDIVLDYVNQQRLKSDVVEDMVKDVLIIGKDIYDSTVEALDKRQVEIDPAQLTDLGVSFLRNIQNIKMLMKTLESAVDLGKELGPIANEVIIDLSKKLGEFEQKGHFELLINMAAVLDNVLAKTQINNVDELSDTIVSLLKTTDKVTQPEVIESLDKVATAFVELKKEDVKPISVWKMLRQINNPEIKNNLGFIMALLKKLNK